MPVPPNKRRLVEIDRSLVENGTLKEGIPCVPVKVMRFRKGERVEIEALGHKFPLAEVRQSLLSAHEEVSKHAFPNNTVEDLCSKNLSKIKQFGYGTITPH